MTAHGKRKSGRLAPLNPAPNAQCPRERTACRGWLPAFIGVGSAAAPHGRGHQLTRPYCPPRRSKRPSGLAAFSVAAIFVPVFVLDADLHATAGSVAIVIPAAVPIPAVPISVPSLPVSAAIHVAVSIPLTISMHSPVTILLPVTMAHMIIAIPAVTIAGMYSPVPTDFTVVGLGLSGLGLLILLWRSVLLVLSRSRLRCGNRRSFSFVLRV
jgi:hypothetical protein